MTKTAVDNNHPGRWSTGLTHTLFIAMLFILPELVMAVSFPHRPSWGFYPGFYIKAALYLGVFYFNYYFLVDRQLTVSRPAIMRFILINLAVIIGVMVLTYFINDMFTPPERHRHSPWRPELTAWQRGLKAMSFMLRDVVMLILAIGLAVALRLSSRWKDMQRQRQEMLAEQRTIELESLRSQLHPHFFFNTLNTIYALIDLRPNDARQAVHQLSGMLRYMLYDDSPTVPLSRELEFIENYVSLMKLRILPDSHPIECDVDVAKGNSVSVPPLLLIPLVENAFKYGITGPRGTVISIAIGLDGGRLVCRTSNSFTATASGTDNTRRSGIGLANLRRRLMLIYGDKASLTTHVAGHDYSAVLSVPCNTTNHE